MCLGRRGDFQGAKDVIAHPFDNVFLHKWDMFIGGGMINGLDAKRPDRRPETLAMLHRPKDRHDLGLIA